MLLDLSHNRSRICVAEQSSDPGEKPGEDVGGCVSDQGALGVVCIEDPHCCPYTVGIRHHPVGAVVISAVGTARVSKAVINDA